MNVIASAAISLDGYLDDCSAERLVLSCAADWAEVHALRAECDALLIGAETLRRDNPSLVIRDPKLRQERLDRGQKADLTKVVITCNGTLDPAARFFTEGEGEKIVLCGPQTAPEQLKRLRRVATVVPYTSKTLTAHEISEQLSKLGINQLMVEGGSRTLTLFLQEDCVDRFRLAVASVFVGDPQAPRLVMDGEFACHLHLNAVRRVGQTAVLEYTRAPHRQDTALLKETFRLAEQAPLSDTAYSVGAIVITANGERFEGYSRQTASDNHAEEEAIALAKAAGATLRGATLYSSMEPCTHRKSKMLSCSALIIAEGFSRVVYAAAEPSMLALCCGRELLSRAGIEVTLYAELSAEALHPNRHILKR